MERIVFGSFLALAAGQDLRRKQVDLWVYLLFGAAALILGIGGPGGGDWGWAEHLAAAGLGGILLGIGAVSGGGIGAGDGLFFAVSGLYVGFWENMMMLCYGTMLCGLFCLGYYVWCLAGRAQDRRHDRIPFLPFVVLPGIWVLLQGM